MTSSDPDGADVAERARRWRNHTYDTVCDVREPWDHGLILRATRYPTYFDFNIVRVEDDPAMSVDELIAVADEALAGLEHRRIDFDLADAAMPLRAEFVARGWEAGPLVWMRHEAELPPGPEVPVEEVPYDAVHDLRIAWHEEDYPGLDPGDYPAEAREVDLSRRAQVLALVEDGVPVGFSQLEREDETAEITQVYVHPDQRGAGRGTALTRQAIKAASEAEDVWIVAAEEGRAKELYARLGFRPAWRTMEVMRLPQ